MARVFDRYDMLTMRGAANMREQSFRIPWLFAILNEWNLYWLRFETNESTEANYGE